jgi:protease YdgD
MRRRVLELLLAAALGGLAGSAALGHDAVDVDERAVPWSSVGKIYNSARASCTGSLIARDKALTAAHCLFNRGTHRFLQADALHFLLGYNRGEYRAYLRVSRYSIGPEFNPEAAPGASVTADWAILILAEQAGMETAPIPLTETAATPGERIMVGGFSQKYPFKMTADADCSVRGVTPNGLIMHDCAVMHGVSGAPLMKRVSASEFRVIGVHVATGVVGGAPMAFAVPTSRFAATSNSP